MYGKISNKITNYLVKNNSIHFDEKDFYAYCINGLIEYSLNILTTIIIGVAVGMLFETLFYLLLIIPLRRVAGGFHAKTAVTCYIFSMLMFLGTIFGARFLSTNELFIKFSPFLFIFIPVIIFMLTPVESVNKKIYKQERILQKKIILVSLIFCIFAFFILLNLEKYTFTFIIYLTNVFVLIFQIVGLFDNICNGD